MNLCQLSLLALLLAVYMISPIAYAYTGPVSFLTERVYADYNINGSLTGTTYTECPDNSNPCRFGFTEAALPNNNDTLQTVRVNLSATTGTNLNSVQTYMSTVSSYPNILDKTKLYVNDSVFGANQNYYKITDVNLAPTLAFNVTYSNKQGGSDFYDYDNIGAGGTTNNMTINVSIQNPSTSKDLSSVTIDIRIDTNSSGANDSMNITQTSLGSISDTDSDGFNDKISWTGAINHGVIQNITFNATLSETINIPNGNTNLTLDSNYSSKGIKSSYSQTSALTGLTIAARYARGSVRQGVDIIERGGGGAWDTRGFLQILASNATQVGSGTELTYNISKWSIYNVSLTTGNMSNLLQNGTFSSTNFTNEYGKLYTTDSTYSSNTSRAGVSGNKPYIASSFDWNVYWNDTAAYYVSYINTTGHLPKLYKIDQSIAKLMGGYLSVGSSTVFNVTDTITYLGDANALGKNIALLSVIPRNTTGASVRTAFTIDNTSIVVSWYNATSLTWMVLKLGNGTSNGVTVAITQPSGANNGLVNLSIPDLSATNLSKNLAPNEKISISFNVTSPSDLQTSDQYQFTGNSTIVTVSGTPETESASPQTMSSSGRQLVGYKDLFVSDPANPTLVNGTLMVQVVGSDITNIYFIDYIPKGTNFTCSNTSILFYNSTDGVIWTASSDFSVNNTGSLVLPDGTAVTSCEYRNYNGSGWTLGSSKAVKVMYKVNITTPGLYEMPMGIAGFDPSSGKTVGTEVYGIVRVTVPEPTVPPEIRQGEFLLTKSVVVGNPVSWSKDFEVFNSNSQYVESTFTTEVFEDATTGYASYIDDLGKEIKEEIVFVSKDGKRYMTWKTRLYPQETRVYGIRILTPPVLETDRDVEVTGVLEDKMVELRLSIFLRNLASEEYQNIQLNLPFSSSSILSIIDGEGNSLPYSGSDSIKVMIPSLGSKGLKEIIIKYKQSYPKIIITPDKERYDTGAPVGLDILVIHGGDTLDYPYIETEVYTPDKELVYANIRQLGKLEPISKTNISETFKVPLGAASGKYIAEARLSSDMATLATGTGNFYVNGSEAGIASWISYIMLIMALGVLYFGVKRVRETSSDTNPEASQGANGNGE